jgi:hypothetical protein
VSLVAEAAVERDGVTTAQIEAVAFVVLHLLLEGLTLQGREELKGRRA